MRWRAIMPLPFRKILKGISFFFLQLLRDADKLDIWRVFIENFQQPVEKRSAVVELGFPNEPHCSQDVLEMVARRELVPLSSVRTLSDFKFVQLSWVFDLTFTESYRIVAERDIVRQLAKTLPEGEGVQQAVGTILGFVAEKIPFVRSTRLHG